MDRATVREAANQNAGAPAATIKDAAATAADPTNNSEVPAEKERATGVDPPAEEPPATGADPADNGDAPAEDGPTTAAAAAAESTTSSSDAAAKESSESPSGANDRHLRALQGLSTTSNSGGSGVGFALGNFDVIDTYFERADGESPPAEDPPTEVPGSPLAAAFDDAKAAMANVFGSAQVQAERASLISLASYIKKPSVTDSWLEDEVLTTWVDSYGKGVRGTSPSGQIVFLDFYRAQLTGDVADIATAFGAMPALEILNVHGNPDFVGSVEHLRVPLSGIRILNISDTGLSGELATFSSWEKCEELSACRCNEIRSEDGLLPLMRMRRLRKLDLSGAKHVKGQIPKELAERGVEVLFKGSRLRPSTLQTSLNAGLYPLYVLPRETILRLPSLPAHADELANGLPSLLKLTRVYQPFNSYHLEAATPSDDRRYVSRDQLAYVSHRGISLEDLRALVEVCPSINYWWLDRSSMPEEGAESWHEAKVSLPYFVKICGSFLAAGDSKSANPRLHFDGAEGLEATGWTRLERICASAPLSVELETSGLSPSGKKKSGPSVAISTEVLKFDRSLAHRTFPYGCDVKSTWLHEAAAPELATVAAASTFRDRLDPLAGSFASDDEKSIAANISRSVVGKFADSALRDAVLKTYCAEDADVEEGGDDEPCKVQ